MDRNLGFPESCNTSNSTQMDFQNHEKGSIITSVNFEIVNFDFEKRNLIEVTVKISRKSVAR